MRDEWDDWFDELVAIGRLLPPERLARPSPWGGLTVADALRDGDLWADRMAAGLSPRQAMDDALRGG